MDILALPPTGWLLWLVMFTVTDPAGADIACNPDTVGILGGEPTTPPLALYMGVRPLLIASNSAKC